MNRNQMMNEIIEVYLEKGEYFKSELFKEALKRLSDTTLTALYIELLDKLPSVNLSGK